MKQHIVSEHLVQRGALVLGMDPADTPVDTLIAELIFRLRGEWHRTAEELPPSELTVLAYWLDVGGAPLWEVCMYYVSYEPDAAIGQWITQTDIGNPDYWQRLTSPLDDAPDAAEEQQP